MDAGATGIKLPHAETAEQVNDLARWVKYPPEGKRAFVDGPNTEFRMPDVGRYCRDVNEATLIFVKIESRSGIENAEGMFESGWVEPGSSRDLIYHALIFLNPQQDAI